MTTTTNKNHTTANAINGSLDSPSFFGALQDTAVGNSKLTIRTIVLPTIIVEPYRKAMIAIIIFRCIISLSFSPSVSLSDLTATVAAYQHDFSHVGSLQVVGILDSSGKSTLVLDLANRSADFTFFMFRSTVTASNIDQLCVSTTLLLEFSLRLPQSSASTNPEHAPIFPPSIIPTPTKSPFASNSSLNFVFENVTDKILTEMNATQLRQFIIDARSNIISPSTGVTIPKKNRSLSFTLIPPLPLYPRWIVFDFHFRREG